MMMCAGEDPTDEAPAQPDVAAGTTTFQWSGPGTVPGRNGRRLGLWTGPERRPVRHPDPGNGRYEPETQSAISCWHTPLHFSDSM